MLDSNDIGYYIERAMTERALAARASNPAVAKIHAEMAERYESIAIDEEAPPLTLRSVG